MNEQERGRRSAWTALATLWLAAFSAAAQGLPPLSKEIIVPATPAEAYRAWTTGAGVQAVMGVNALIELRINGPYEWYFVESAPEGSRGGEGNRVLSFVADRMVSFTWNAPPSFPEERGERTFVVVDFTPVEGGTRVRLTHDGWPAEPAGRWAEVHAYFDRAWESVLSAHRRAFEQNGGRLPPASQPAIAAPVWQHYAYFIRPVREGFFSEPTEEENRVVGQHVVYIRDLQASGRLVLAGPCLGEMLKPEASAQSVCFDLPSPGVVIYRAHDDADAKRIMENDPAVLAGVFKGVAVRYHAAFGAR